jgi:hypothetical protein
VFCWFRCPLAGLRLAGIGPRLVMPLDRLSNALPVLSYWMWFATCTAPALVVCTILAIVSQHLPLTSVMIVLLLEMAYPVYSNDRSARLHRSWNITMSRTVCALAPIPRGCGLNQEHECAQCVHISSVEDSALGVWQSSRYYKNRVVPVNSQYCYTTHPP